MDNRGERDQSEQAHEPEDQLHEESGGNWGVKVAALRHNFMSKVSLDTAGPSRSPVKQRTKIHQASTRTPSKHEVKSEQNMVTHIFSKLPFKFKEKKEEGRPRTQYQLVAKKQCIDGEVEAESKLRRWTIGSRDREHSVKTVLLVGESGSGKSKLIDVMLNYFLGVESGDSVWFELVDEENKRQSQSQTSAVTMYEILGYDSPRFPHFLCIIDTPGYGDTRGLDHDAQVAKSLYDLFRCKDGIRQIDAVGLVLKESTNRLSDRQRYIFNSVVSLFGKDIGKNIVALITHSNGLSATNALQALEDADIRIARDKHNEPLYFCFDNCQNDVTKGNKREKRALEYAWETSNKGMEEFLEFLKAAKPQKVEMTVEVLNKRIQLEACFYSLQERIKVIEKKQIKLNQIKDAINSYVDEAENLPMFTITVEETYREKVPLKRGKALFCPVCEENCHYPGCTLAPTPAWCEVMKDGFCTSCSGKCHHSKHVRGRWMYAIKTRTVDKTVEDIALKYAITKKLNQKVELVVALKRDIEEAKREKNTFIEDAYKCIVKLDEISLNKNSVCTFMHLGFLKEKLIELGYEDKVNKLDNIERRMPKEDKGGIGYAHRKK